MNVLRNFRKLKEIKMFIQIDFCRSTLPKKKIMKQLKTL